jgi:hypothetical protein
LLHISSFDRENYLRRTPLVDGRGVQFTEKLIREVHASLPGTEEAPRAVTFAKAVFPDDASFGGATFGDGSSFAGAVFGARADFRGATFGKDVTFAGATFAAHPTFRGARFDRDAVFVEVDFGFNPWFRGTVFGDRASFHKAKFGDHAYFRNTAFGRGVSFEEATFGRSATFIQNVRFEGSASFANATFGDGLGLGSAVLDGPTAFTNATFGAQARFNVFSHEALTFANARFGRHAEIDFTGKELDLRGADFSEGGGIRAQGTDIHLSRAKFGAPFLLTRRPPAGDEQATAAAPRVMSLDEADVRNLVIDQADLGRCRFARAHNLDQLRVGSSDQFLLPERKLGLTRRRIVIEEYLWRVRHRRATRWSLPDPPAGEEVPGDPRAEARQVEQTYRALRKAFEDLKNEPGSADFYYGEMEMRRHGSESAGERFLLYCYWLLAGYGLRAWRAFAALAVTVAIATVIFVSVGFAGTATTTYVPAAAGAYVQTSVPGPKPGWLDAVSYSVHGVTSLIRPIGTVPLTRAGTCTELVLRILGPLLLGLAVLSIRARVKR